jgi:plastocyanin
MPRLTRRLILTSACAAALVPHAVFAATTHQVSIANMAFTPTRITIKAGDSIEWRNRDSAEHTATDKGGAWDTGILRRNKKAVIRFDTPGDYDYFCEVHPNMQGKITVT